MKPDEMVMILFCHMAQQSLNPDTYEMFVQVYNEMLEIRKLHLMPL